MWGQVIPDIERWRAMGVFGPAVTVPADADRQIQLLGATGYWTESVVRSPRA